MVARVQFEHGFTYRRDVSVLPGLRSLYWRRGWDELFMAQGFQIPPMPEFQPDGELGASLAARWQTWLSEFEMLLAGSGITNATRKRALLVYLARSRVREIFQHLTDVGGAADYDTAKKSL